MEIKKNKVAIIGAGIFGCTTALELAKNGFEVTIFERSNDILKGASTVNHLRHHLGFHYPRSKETVLEIQQARASFEKEYGRCLSEVFDDYYAVSLEGSMTTVEGFLKFCHASGLPFEEEWPGEEFLNKDKVGLCIKVPERVYDPGVLRRLIFMKMVDNPVNLKFNHEIIDGGEGDKFCLAYKHKGMRGRRFFDYVINATYSNFNNFNKWFDYPRKRLQYELMELLELEIPNQEKIGLTIMDGEFSALLPRGEKGTFTLGHVDASVLERKVAYDLDPVVMASKNTFSNATVILREGIKDFPFLKNAKVVDSLFVTRVVKPDVEDTDERPSEITDYKNGSYSIFGGKVITCVDIAREVTKKLIKRREKDDEKMP